VSLRGDSRLRVVPGPVRDWEDYPLLAPGTGAGRCHRPGVSRVGKRPTGAQSCEDRVELVLPWPARRSPRSRGHGAGHTRYVDDRVACPLRPHPGVRCLRVHGLEPDVGVSWLWKKVQLLVEELAQAEMIGQRRRLDQPGVGDGVVVVELIQRIRLLRSRNRAEHPGKVPFCKER